MKVLVTGATGFLGRELVKKLSHNGYPCRCLVRNIDNAHHIKIYQNIEVFQGDITQPHTLEGIDEGIDVVFHLASIMGHVGTISGRKKDWEQFLTINFNGTKNLASKFSNKSLKKFIYISSTAAMGIISDIVADENTPDRAKTPYQVSKIKTEKLLLDYHQSSGLPVVILRPSVFYGNGVVGDLIRLTRFMKRGLLPHIGWGDNLSPIVHVDDLVDACVASIERGISGEKYIITHKSYKMSELTGCVKRELNIKPYELHIPVFAAKLIAVLSEISARIFKIKPFITLESVRGICSNRMYSTKKAKQELGFDPKNDLERCVKDALRWSKENDLI